MRATLRDFTNFLMGVNVGDKPGEERHYNAKGAISFVLRWHTDEPDLAKLAEEIREADRMFPWRDDFSPGAGQEKPESIFYLSNGEVVVHNYTTPVKIIWFGIVPKPDCLRKGQVYAYEKYLAKLAKELAEKKLSGIAEVRSLIEVRASTGYQTG